MPHRAPRKYSLVTDWVLAILLVGSAALILLFVTVDRMVAHETAAMEQEAVEADLMGLFDVMALDGADALITRIESRVQGKSRLKEKAYYLLTDGNGRTVAGDMPELVPLLDGSQGSYRMIEVDGESMFAQTGTLPNGMKLYVAHESQDRATLLANIRRDFFIVGGVMFVTVLAAAVWALQLLRRQIREVNRVFRSAEFDGDAAPSGGSRKSELEELALHATRVSNRLRSLLRLQRQVTDNLAHEIRTPLIHLDSRLRDALRDNQSPELDQNLRQARAEIRDIVRILEALLDIALTESRTGDRAGLDSFDLSATVTRLADIFQETAEDMGITLTPVILPNVTLNGDRAMIERLVVNLLDNAFKFTPSGGEVQVKVVKGPKIIVQDTGPGVPDEYKSRIFDRFERGDRQQKTKGHGLGLSLCRAIAERHGMEILVEDAKPGARFVVQPARNRKRP